MDPRAIGPQLRKDNLSELMIAKGKASQGEVVNFCPFGCETEDLDDNGYCRHLVGFSNDGKSFEAMVTDQKTGRRSVMGSRVAPVEKGDKLVRITVSSRVYRDVDEEALDEATRPGS